jgi:hypothetical protein
MMYRFDDGSSVSLDYVTAADEIAAIRFSQKINDVAAGRMHDRLLLRMIRCVDNQVVYYPYAWWLSLSDAKCEMIRNLYFSMNRGHFLYGSI